VQWSTAGTGVLHTEIPEQEQRLLHGVQICLNLPEAKEMNPAAHQVIGCAEPLEKWDDFF